MKIKQIVHWKESTDVQPSQASRKCLCWDLLKRTPISHVRVSWRPLLFAKISVSSGTKSLLASRFLTSEDMPHVNILCMHSCQEKHETWDSYANCQRRKAHIISRVQAMLRCFTMGTQVEKARRQNKSVIDACSGTRQPIRLLVCAKQQLYNKRPCCNGRLQNLRSSGKRSEGRNHDWPPHSECEWFPALWQQSPFSWALPFVLLHPNVKAGNLMCICSRVSLLQASCQCPAGLHCQHLSMACHGMIGCVVPPTLHSGQSSGDLHKFDECLQVRKAFIECWETWHQSNADSAAIKQLIKH